MSSDASGGQAPQPADDAPTPTDLITAVRRQRRAAGAAEAELLGLAVEWAHSHPELDRGHQVWWRPGKKGQVYAEHIGAVMDPDDGAPVASSVDDIEELDWFAIPQIRWDAAAPFAAANQMSTTAGRAYLRDALVLHHRLPNLYTRVRAGAVPVWKARKVAQTCLGLPADVLAYIDETFTPTADTSGLITLEQMLVEAMLRLYPEQAEHDRLAGLDHHHVTLEEGDLTNTNGLARITIDGDWLDLKDFDLAVASVAEALKHTERGEHEALDVRRAMAIGVLAHPDLAQALLDDHVVAGGKPRRQLNLTVHLTPDVLDGRDVVCHDDTGRPLFADHVAAWASRPDTTVTVRGLIDLTEIHDPFDPTDFEGQHPGQSTVYKPTKHVRDTVLARDRCCVFPYCRRPGRTGDIDHICPYRISGRTCVCDLAPLCRHHHQLKTHTGWAYRAIEPGVYQWTDPHGQTFLRTHDGTTDTTANAKDPPAAA